MATLIVRRVDDALVRCLKERAAVMLVWFEVVALGPFVPRLDEDDLLLGRVGVETLNSSFHLAAECSGFRGMQHDAARTAAGCVGPTR